MKLYKTPNRHLAITPGGLTKSIDRLEAARLVRRAPDPDDGRGTLVALTKKGGRTIAKAFDDDLGAHERLFRGLTAAKRKRIASALRELLDAFEGPRLPRSSPPSEPPFPLIGRGGAPPIVPRVDSALLSDSIQD